MQYVTGTGTGRVPRNGCWSPFTVTRYQLPVPGNRHAHVSFVPAHFQQYHFATFSSHSFYCWTLYISPKGSDRARK
jgi:hypothetical protein